MTENSKNVLLYFAPISVIGGMLKGLFVVNYPALKPFSPIFLWIVAGSFAFYWLRQEHLITGRVIPKWITILSIWPIVQVFPLAYYLGKTRKLKSSLTSIILMIVILIVGYTLFLVGTTVGRGYFG